jgi:hypothetical protein
VYTALRLYRRVGEVMEWSGAWLRDVRAKRRVANL